MVTGLKIKMLLRLIKEARYRRLNFIRCGSILLSLWLLSPVGHAQQTPKEPLVNDFDTLDVDQDGYITRHEADDKNIWYHFEAIDKNRDQVLSREEFITYIAEENPLLGESLPQDELPQAYLRERTQKEADVVTNPELLPKIENDFDDLDNNDDGFISRSESRSDAIYRHFSHIDRNDDSRIGVSEYNDYLYKYGTLVASEALLNKRQR
jgi:cold shock CspA family protein